MNTFLAIITDPFIIALAIFFIFFKYLVHLVEKHSFDGRQSAMYFCVCKSHLEEFYPDIFENNSLSLIDMRYIPHEQNHIKVMLGLEGIDKNTSIIIDLDVKDEDDIRLIDIDDHNISFYKTEVM